MSKVLFLNHSIQRCGIREYGYRAGLALAKSTKHRFLYYEINDSTTFRHVVKAEQPRVIFFNWNPGTMPWLSPELWEIEPECKCLALVHDHDPSHLNLNGIVYIDDRQIPIQGQYGRYSVGRLLPKIVSSGKVIPNSVGTHGFGFRHKGIHHIVDLINEEYDTSAQPVTLRLSLPLSHFTNPEGHGECMSIIEECKRDVKPGVIVEVNQEFMEQQELLTWMSCSEINVFLYDDQPGRGPASCLDVALASERPIAINGSCMFNHIPHDLPVRVGWGNTLPKIVARGPDILAQLRHRWSEENYIKNFEQIVDTAICKD